MTAEHRKTRATLKLLGAIALLGCNLCGPTPDPPPTDTCSAPQTGRVTTVELATPQIDARRFATDTAQDQLAPRALAPNDVLWRIRGGQGAEMVPVRLIFRGPEVPACVAQDTWMTVGGRLAARNRDNVATYELEPGARATKTLWLAGAFEFQGTLQTDSAGQKAQLDVRTEHLDRCESAVACPCSHAFFVSDSGFGLSDAGATLWSAFQRCDGGACQAAAKSCAEHLH